MLTTYPNRYAEFRPEFKAFEIFKNVQVRRFKIPNHQSGFADQIFAFSIFALKVLVYTFFKNYDTIFVTSSRLATASLGTLVAGRTRAKLIIDIRDIFTETITDVLGAKSFRSRVLLRLLRFIERKTLNGATTINVVSPGFTKYIRNISQSTKITEYTNGIDQLFLEYKQQEIVANTKIKIVYAGNLGASQDMARFVPNFAKRYEDAIDFHIYGSGGEKDKLYAAMNKLGCRNLHLHDPIAREQLPEIYANADVLFLTLASKDAFKKVIPSKLFEYGSTSKPILAGLHGYSADFAKQNIAGVFIFEPENFEQMCSSFDRIRSSNEVYLRQDFVEKYARQKIMLGLIENCILPNMSKE